MHWSHLFEIDETPPVNKPCKQKQVMIPGPLRMRPLSDWWHENEGFQAQKFSLKIYPHHPLSYTITKKPKRVNLRRKSHWGSWSSWGSPLIALSLGFTVIRVLFRFLIERILFRVLSDRVFFESSEIGSSSLGYAVIDSSLHQCSFSAMLLFFYQIVLLLFLSKQMFCFALIIILKNN